jgi:hypothetical protein
MGLLISGQQNQPENETAQKNRFDKNNENKK